MIASFSLLIPPLFLVLAREKVFKTSGGVFERLAVYAFAALGLNWCMMLLLHYIFDSTGSLFCKLETYGGFACKYIALSMAAAGLEPYIERFFREDLKVHWPGWEGLPYPRHLKAYAVGYAVLLFLLNLIRIFDDNFWSDEAATASQMRGTFASITSWAARDVHPPLYYYMLKIMYILFGEHGWAYHALSLIPFFVIVVLSLKIFWKKFGWGTSIIMITFAGLSNNALCQNIEIRMYSWAGLFVLLSFYMLWEIIEKKRKRDHVLFVIFSLGAAYTHYFAMVAVAFFYLVLMALALFPKRLCLRTVSLTWAGAIIGYMPWVIQFWKTVCRTAKSYWVTSTPTFGSAIRYLFSSRPSGRILWMVLLAGVILFFLYETKVLTVRKDEDNVLHLFLSFEQIRISDLAVWVASGIFCIVGTIVFAIAYSYIVRPVFTLRYIYAISAVAWLVLAISISRSKLGRIWTVILWIYLLIGFIPGYRDTYIKEKETREALQKTLEATCEIHRGDIILDNDRLTSLVGYYYPDVERQYVWLDELPELDADICYYLFVSGDPDMTAAFKDLDAQGYDHVQIVDAGYFGDRIVHIYQIKKR